MTKYVFFGTLCFTFLIFGCNLDKIENEDMPNNLESCFSANPNFCDVGCQITLDASCSQGAIKYSWDFDGDGIIDQEGIDSIIQHVFTNSAIFQVELTVENSKGVTKQSIVAVEISQMPASFSLESIQGNNCSELPCNIQIGTKAENVDSIQWVVTLEDTIYEYDILRTTFNGSLGLDLEFTNHGIYTVSATAFGGDTTIKQSHNDSISLVPYTFMESYDNEAGSSEDRFLLMEIDDNNDLITSGWTPEEATNNWDIGIWRIDNQGQLLNTKRAGGTKVDQPYGFMKSSTGDFIISGFRDNPSTVGYLLGYEKSFTEKFSPVVREEYKTIYDVTEDADGNYIVFGATGNDELELLEVKSSGAIFANPWKFTFAADKKLGYLSDSEVIYFDGSYYAIYFERNNSSLYRIPFKASTSTVVSPKIIDISKARTVRLINNQLLIGGAEIILTDLDGNELFRNSEKSCEGADLAKDGNIIIISYDNSLTLSKLDQSLNLIWEKQIGDGIYTNIELVPQEVRVGSDGCIYVCGYFFRNGEFTTDAFLIRTDSNGNVLSNISL